MKIWLIHMLDKSFWYNVVIVENSRKVLVLLHIVFKIIPSWFYSIIAETHWNSTSRDQANSTFDGALG